MMNLIRSIPRTSYWLPFVSGLLYAVSFPPLSLWPILFVSLVPLFLFLWEEKAWWRIVIGAYIYCITYAVFDIIFLPDPLLLGGGALLWLLVFAPFVILIKRHAHRSAAFFALIVPPLVAAEYFAGNFSFLPAFLIMAGVPLGGTPFQFVALLGGLAAASAFVGFVNAAMAEMILRRIKGEGTAAAKAAAVLLILLLCGLALRLFSYADEKLPSRIMSVSTGDSFDLAARGLDDDALAQTPAGDAHIKAVVQALLSPIGERVETERPDVVVFPESLIDLRLQKTAYPKASAQIGVENAGPLLEEYSAFAVVHKVWLVATLITFEAQGKKYLSTVVIDPQGDFTGLYHKRLLTFASEYWPFGTWMPAYWQWEAQYLPKQTRQEAFVQYNPTGQYTFGRFTQTPLMVDGVKVGPLICLEGHFPFLYSGWKAQGATVIFFSGSNKWLDHWRTGFQAFQTKVWQLESIHTGLPIVVSTGKEDPLFVFPDGVVVYAPATEATSTWAAAVR